VIRSKTLSPPLEAGCEVYRLRMKSSSYGIMARGKQTSTELRAIIVALSKAGFPNFQIASILKRNASTISKVIIRYIKLGTLSSHHPGRKPTLNNREHRHLVSSVLRNRFAPTRQHLADLNLHDQITINTANKILRDEGLPARAPRKKPYLKAKHRLKRLIWAKQHRHWTKEDWRRVIFTDESSFEVGKPSGRILVRRRVGEEFKEECVMPTFKSGRSSSNNWGGIYFNRRSELVCLRGQGRMTAVKYSDLILHKALKTTYIEAQDAREDSKTMLVAEDNAPCHTAKLCKVAHEE